MVVASTQSRLCTVYGSVIKCGKFGCRSRIFRSLVHKKFQTFDELLEEVFSTGSTRKVPMFATVAWCLWQRRNRMREC